VKEARSTVLETPIVIIPEELNSLLNPAHPSFQKISFGKVKPFILDQRLP
jgi:hypothetical protein